MKQLPPWIQLLALPFLAVLLGYVHHLIQPAIFDIGTLPRTRPFELAGMLLSSFIGPALTGLIFAFPTARLYGRLSVFAASLIALPTVIFLGSFYIHNSGRPFVIAIYLLEVLSLMTLAPLFAWLVGHRITQRGLRPAA